MLILGCPYASGFEITQAGDPIIRVGVWKNPPVVLQKANKEWGGIAIDVLKAIARRHHWKLQFIPGSFSEQMKNLEQGKIDLLSAIAYSKSRARKFVYTKHPLISNWGLVYVRPGSYIGSLTDLENHRVAVMKGNIHYTAFRKLIKQFGINAMLIEEDSFGDVLKSVQSGEVDAGVVNRLFGTKNADHYAVVESGIVFNPINIHYAFSNHRLDFIKKNIDADLVAFKSEPDSVYYQSLQSWMHISPESKFPKWVIWLMSGMLGSLLLMFMANYFLSRQVALRTSELQFEVDERRQAQERLDRLAFFDSVTGLPNRVAFYEKLKAMIANNRASGSRLAVFFIDLDRFKTINDSLGHDIGDILIEKVAKRLHSILREQDELNRFGGDEFVAIIPTDEETSGIGDIAERMLKCFAIPVDVGVTEIYTSASIGVALYPDDGTSNDVLLKSADIAMYHAKAQGGDNYQFYNEELSTHVRKRLSLETRLRQALEHDELRLHYQPIIDLSTQQPVGVEALLRWEDPERGTIPPDEFISVAEETGIIIAYGEWVLDTACQQVRHWCDMGMRDLRLAVNVSARQFEHHRIHEAVTHALKNSGLASAQLELEITEQMFLNIKENVRKVMENLRDDGISLAIDDFGTGYSSLSYLKSLPINTLKIDRSFVKDIPGDKDDIQIASTIMMMAHGLDLDVVAEGIETSEQLDFFIKRGCGRAQGYMFSKPRPAEEMQQWLLERLGK
jgi:diguanylate cyclase (GGDEF)-like protein